MTDRNDDNENLPADSWEDIIEDFDEVQRRFREEARKNRRKQAEAPPPTGDLEGVVRQPTHGHDPNVHLLIPHYSGPEKQQIPRRPKGPPPLTSAAMRVTEAGSDDEVDRLQPDTRYQIECTVRNLGGNTATSTTFEVFFEHKRPRAVLDTAPDGVFEAVGETSRITGFCTLGKGSDRLFVLGYVPPSPPQNPRKYTPKPENVIFRSSNGQFNDGGIGGDVRADRTFDFKESFASVDELTMSQNALFSGTFRIRLYDNDVVDANPPYFRSPTEVPVDPTATYLRTASDDNASAAKPINLASLGIPPGDTVRLERVGRYQKQGSGGKGLIGVFSESDILHPSNQLNRVRDAVDAGNEHDIQTVPTFTSEKKTDIPEDFKIANRDGTDPSVTLNVPRDVQYLFVSPIDNFFQDNSVPSDGEFKVRITSEQRKKDTLSKTISTLENQGTLLTDTEGRFPEPPINNKKEQLNLASDVTNSALVDPPGNTTLPKTVEIPSTGQTMATTTYQTPDTKQYSLTAFHARVYSLAVPDDPANWDELNHTTSRFVGRTEETWE